MYTPIKQHQVLPLKKRFFKKRNVAIAYFEQFTGYDYERAKNEAGIPWNVWPVDEGPFNYFIGTAGEWIEGSISKSFN